MTVFFTIVKIWRGFPGGSVVKNTPANAENTGLIPDLERSHRPGVTKLFHHNS